MVFRNTFICIVYVELIAFIFSSNFFKCQNITLHFIAPDSRRVNDQVGRTMNPMKKMFAAVESKDNYPWHGEVNQGFKLYYYHVTETSA